MKNRVNLLINVCAIVALGNFLIIAAMESDPKKIKPLSQKELNEALFKAALDGHSKEVEFLIQSGANVNAVDKNRASVLMGAARKGHKEVIETLFRAGADLNARDCIGTTALMQAAVCGHREVLECLLNLGSNLLARNNDGRTAIMEAGFWGHRLCCELLIERYIRIPNDEQRKKIYTFLICMKKYGFGKDVLSCFRPHVLNTIGNENRESKEFFMQSIAYKEIINIPLICDYPAYMTVEQRSTIKKSLLKKYTPQQKYTSHQNSFDENQNSEWCHIL